LEADTFSSSEGLLRGIGFNQFTTEALAGLLVLIILMVTSALISGSEVALFSLEPKEIEDLKKSKRRKPHLVLKLLSKPENLLAALLTGGNFINIAIVLLTAHITNSLIDFTNAPTLGFIFQTIVITFMILFFGEIIPKVYAAHYSKNFALKISPFINILAKITHPVNYLLIHSTSFVNKRLSRYKKDLSIEEISKALKLTDEDELSEEKDILEGIVKFGTKTVSEIMKPRLDVTSIEAGANFDEVLRVIRESGYSRIPVYKESLDNVRGILYIKDLLAHLDKGTSFRWQPLMRQPFFVPESKKIDDLLEEFQKSKVHMAFVVDEYGGTSGLVTLEDILEEIVGDIADEFDEENRFFVKISEFEYLFNGNTLLNDFYKATGYDDNVFDEIKGEADTLAGLILELTREMPEMHEKIQFKNFTFEVEAVDPRRINKIRVTINSSVESS
jgi:putative hemolysin